ncbi:MAG: CocE/NonD family hydrolase, partial [Steroidobacteraceae bacterium]
MACPRGAADDLDGDRMMSRYDDLEEPSPLLTLGADIVVERDVRVRMSDGVHISVDVFRPSTPGPHPALFGTAPYIKQFDDRPIYPTYRFRETLDIAWWVRRGYVYVHGDTRGAGRSLEGDFEGWGAREQRDLYEVIEWSAAQPWCTGRVGMIGYSYYGVCQWLAATLNPPSLKCIAPYDASVDPYRDFFFHGGIWSMGFAQWWVPKFRKRVILDMPGAKPPDVMKFDFCDASFRHPYYDEFWRERDGSARFDRITVPVYSIGNWNMVGLHLRGNVLGYESVRSPKKLMLCGGFGGIHA